MCGEFDYHSVNVQVVRHVAAVCWASPTPVRTQPSYDQITDTGKRAIERCHLQSSPTKVVQMAERQR